MKGDRRSTGGVTRLVGFGGWMTKRDGRRTGSEEETTAKSPQVTVGDALAELPADLRQVDRGSDALSSREVW